MATSAEASCVVCNVQQARSHDHYGCKGVCSSCRNFFRRSVQTGQFGTFGCTAKACVIDSRNRKSCKKCRFDKCLGAGMKPNYVSTSSRTVTSASTSTAVSSSDSATTSSIRTSSLSGSEDCQTLQIAWQASSDRTIERLAFQFTSEEFNWVQYFLQTFNDTAYSQYYLLYSEEPEIIRTWFNFNTTTTGGILPYDVIKKMEWSDTVALTEVGLIFLRHEEDLSSFEQSVLVQSNIGKLMAYLWVICNEFVDNCHFLRAFIQFGIDHIDHVGVSNILPKIQDLMMEHYSGSDGYRAVFASPWAPHAQIEEKHLEICRSIWRWSRRPEDNQLDYFQMILLTMIVLLSCDDVNFDQDRRRRIEALQLKYILMYQRYLKWAYPREANFKFACGLMVLHNAKELQHYHSLRLPV